MSTGKFLGEPDEILGVTFLMEWHPIQKGVAILLVATCYGNRYKLGLDGPFEHRLNLPTFETRII